MSAATVGRVAAYLVEGIVVACGNIAVRYDHLIVWSRASNAVILSLCVVAVIVRSALSVMVTGRSLARVTGVWPHERASSVRDLL